MILVKKLSFERVFTRFLGRQLFGAYVDHQDFCSSFLLKVIIEAIAGGRTSSRSGSSEFAKANAKLFDIENRTISSSGLVEPCSRF